MKNCGAQTNWVQCVYQKKQLFIFVKELYIFTAANNSAKIRLNVLPWMEMQSNGILRIC